jgi:hypothetical protein
MKRWLVIAIGAACWIGGNPVWAQPPLEPAADLQAYDPRRPPLLNEEHMAQMFTHDSPEGIVRHFLHHSNLGHARYAAFLVAGADWQSGETEKLGEYLLELKTPKWQLYTNFVLNFGEPFDIKTLPTGPPPPLADDVKEVNLTLAIGVEADTGIGMSQAEKVTLRREQTQGGPVWRIVPGMGEIVKGGLRFSGASDGIIHALSSQYANPKTALAELHFRQSSFKMKYLCLAYIDLNGKMPQDLVLVEQTLLKYLAGPSALTAPEDAPGTKSYHFNEQLLGKDPEDIKRPDLTVAFYMGKADDLDFRYDGKTIVGYVDGRIRILDRQETANLKWTP